MSDSEPKDPFFLRHPVPQDALHRKKERILRLHFVPLRMTPFGVVWIGKKDPPKGGSFIDYFFIAALTICRISSGVSMGQAISFLGQTAAHRPQEVHLE